KGPTGRICCNAFHEAGHVTIQISDDGRGLDTQRILAKAIETGIVERDAKLSEEEIHRLIFHAGLTTAKTVSDLSGRGVGMDVVRRNIERLRGRIDIASTPG